MCPFDKIVFCSWKIQVKITIFIVVFFIYIYRPPIFIFFLSSNRIPRFSKCTSLMECEYIDGFVLSCGNYVSPPPFCGETYCFCPVRLSVTQIVSATPLKLLNRISWNLVDSKDTICSCAYYQEILIAWILWELCPFELRNFPKYTSEAPCQHNSSETTEQNFMKLGR